MFALIGIGLFLGPLIIALVALSRLSAVKRRLDGMEAHLHNLDLEFRQSSSGSETAPEEPAVAATQSEEVVRESLPDDGNEQDETAPSIEPDAPLPPKKSLASWIEEELTSRWLVWLGGLAMAIAGYFLVLYAVEHGLLGPRGRIIAGVLLGAALAAAGEYLRRRPVQRAIASLRPDYIPQAFTAAGLATLFGSFYAAHGLYDLIGPLSAFVLLAVVAVAAFALSVLHGVFVAALGLLAGFVTPALIPSDAPSSIALFGYLLIVSAACSAVMWYRPWAWLGFGTVAGSVLWSFIWVVGPFAQSDSVVIALYWTAVTGLHVALAGYTNDDRSPPVWAQLPPAHLPDSIAWVTAIAAVVMVNFAGLADGHSNPFLFAACLFAGSLAAAAAWRDRLDGLVILAGMMILMAFGLWTFRSDVLFLLPIPLSFVDGAVAYAPAPDFWRLLQWAGAVGMAWLAGTYLWLRKAERPHVWAAMSVIVPVLLLSGIYGRLGDHLSDRQWALIALGLAMVLVGYAAQLRRGRDDDRLTLPLGIYAIGVAAGVSLVMVFLLKDAWLTVALAAQLPAIAWIINRLDLPILRRVAVVIAAVCVVRLALNPFLLDYARDTVFKDHWVLYAYGLPLIAFHLAFVMFKRTADDFLVTVLEGGRLLFATLLISAEIRVLAAGSLTSGRFDLLEAGLHASSWLIMAWSRWRAYLRGGRLINWWGAAILTTLGTVSSLGLSLVIFGPLFNSVRAGPLPILNALAPAYLIPATALGLILWQASEVLHKLVRWALGAAAFCLGWAWLTFETRHAFQGSLMRPYASDAESYAYSAVWLVAAFAILFAAIYVRRTELRYASLTLIVIAVAKVFLVDMADLEGLYRVASFLGLGLSLVGIGWVYQRFVFAGQAAKDSNI